MVLRARFLRRGTFPEGRDPLLYVVAGYVVSGYVEEVVY
jgi:hypothetical protein